MFDWSALGTWVTGGAALLIALMAHRFTAAQAERIAERDRKAARAFARMAVIELVAVHVHVRAIAGALAAAIAEPSVHTLKGVAGVSEDIEASRPREWLSTSPAYADLDDGTGLTLATTLTVCAALMPQIATMAKLLPAGLDVGIAPSDPYHRETLDQLSVHLSRLDRELGAAVVALRPVAGLQGVEEFDY